MAPGEPGHGAWRALRVFWAVVLGSGLAAAGVLAWLGAPPAMAPRTLIPAPEASTAAHTTTAPAAASVPAAPPAGATRTAATTPAPRPPAALPDAPEPPPLAEPDRLADTGHPIAPPDPALLDSTPDGLLPRIGADGTLPRRAYARAFNRADTRPRVGLVLPGVTEPALHRLPPAIALALDEPGPALLAAARARGNETLLLLPAPGSTRLLPVLGRFAGYVGALGGGEADMLLARRGLLRVEPRPGGAAPEQVWGRSVDLVLEAAPTRGEIDRQLERLERLARERGSALGLLPGAPPLLVERVAAWAAGLDARGIALAPVTALIRRPSRSQEP